jgi:hypothetical protein
LKERLDRLMNRINVDERRAVVAAIVARIPVPTTGEVAAMQLADAESDAAFWRGCSANFSGDGEAAVLGRMMLSAAQDRVDGNNVFASFAEGNAAKMQTTVDRLKRGESVSMIDDETRAQAKALAMRFHMQAAKML